MEISINNIQELKKAVDIFKDKYLCKYNIFLLSGDLGVGKTTFLKYLLYPMPVTSPTFNVLNIYNNKYWHMDLYKKEIFTSMDMEDYGIFHFLTNKENKLFIEWWEKINFPLDGIELYFFFKNDHRFISVKK